MLVTPSCKKGRLEDQKFNVIPSYIASRKPKWIHKIVFKKHNTSIVYKNKTSSFIVSPVKGTKGGHRSWPFERYSKATHPMVISKEIHSFSLFGSI